MNATEIARKKDEARTLLTSPRGQYLISQALCNSIEYMNTVPKRYREISNISDMETLLILFPIYKAIATVRGFTIAGFKKQLRKENKNARHKEK